MKVYGFDKVRMVFEVPDGTTIFGIGAPCGRCRNSSETIQVIVYNRCYRCSKKWHKFPQRTVEYIGNGIVLFEDRYTGVKDYIEASKGFLDDRI